MYCLFLLCASLFINLPQTCVSQAEDDPTPFATIIHDYFKSESVGRLRKEWETVRKSFENALVMFMKQNNERENNGSPGMNVYVRKRRDRKLADGYYHTDNQVRVIFKDLNLDAIPLYLNPDVKLNLASNVLKLYTTLGKMIIHADYVVIRNKSDIIHDPELQDPSKSSPFLFEQVHEVGKVAITVQGCELKGFITLELDIDVVALGHNRFKIFNCVYTIDIYRPGDECPPVIARYNMSDDQGLDLTDLLQKPLVMDSLLPTLQTALFSFVNTTAIFGYSEIREFGENQAIVLQLIANELAEMVRRMNKLTVEKNNGAVQMVEYKVHWDDGRTNPSKHNEAGNGESMKLTQMVLTGLDTLYSAHKGGPFEFDTVRIAEKLQFSSIQVRGRLETSTSSDSFAFAAEISDLTMNLHIELSESNNISKPDAWIKDRKLEVEGLRKMTFTVPLLISGVAENLIGGYLLKEVPKLINAHSMAMFDQAMQQRSKVKLLEATAYAGGSKYQLDDLAMKTDVEYADDEIGSGILTLGNKVPEEITERAFMVKRFTSLTNLRHPHRGRIGKRVAKNEIRNK